MGDKFCPFVFWAQTDSHISLKIDLQNVKVPEVILCEDELEFSATGSGARGQNEYHFVLEFFLPINSKESQYRITERQVDFQIKKQTAEFWPRLTLEQKKPIWLKIDFERWKPEIDDDDLEVEEEKDFLKGHNDLFKDLDKNSYQILPNMFNDLKKLYLFLYNLFQFLGFSYVSAAMFINYVNEGPNSMEGTYANLGYPMKFLHLLMLLEIIHPLTGFTKGSFTLPALQICGRLIILFAMIDAEPRMHTKPIVFYLFFVYSLVELVRYPYYMLRVYNASFRFLTWLRYTIWIPLYPFGFLCEGIIILRDIPYFEETRRFCISLPNAWNFSFDFPLTMRIYLLCLCFPLMYCMMTHMYRQRLQQLGPKSWQKKLC